MAPPRRRGDRERDLRRSGRHHRPGPRRRHPFHFLANGRFTEENPELVLDVLDELARVGRAAQGDLATTVPALSKITGVPEDITRVTLTRAGFDLGRVGPVSSETQAYQQALADEFLALGILPKALTIQDIVWQPKAS